MNHQSTIPDKYSTIQKCQEKLSFPVYLHFKYPFYFLFYLSILFPITAFELEQNTIQNETEFNSRINFSFHDIAEILNQSSEPEAETFLKSLTVRIVLIIIYSVVFFAILLGNALLIGALSSNRVTLTPTNIFVLNLAFADLGVAIFCVYQNLSLYLLSEWIFSDLLCRMYHFVHAISYTASVCIHVAIALERYLALVRPFWARVFLTRTRLRTVIITVWLLSALACLPRFLIYKTITSHFNICEYS